MDLLLAYAAVLTVCTAFAWSIFRGGALSELPHDARCRGADRLGEKTKTPVHAGGVTR